MTPRGGRTVSPKRGLRRLGGRSEVFGNARNAYSGDPRMAKIRKFAPRLARKRARSSAAGASDTPLTATAGETAILPGAACRVCRGHGKAAWIDGSGWRSLDELSDEERPQAEDGRIRVVECEFCGG